MSSTPSRGTGLPEWHVSLIRWYAHLHLAVARAGGDPFPELHGGALADLFDQVDRLGIDVLALPSS